MSFSFLARKLACGIALAVPVVVSAQSGFAPLGGEYAIAGALPGDQVMPSASVNANGGYLVWQDNATDGDGWGISGRALNSALSGALAPFRVNGTSKGDQENARVALLNDGGAVFVWQGGRQGFQHIYARFLSSSNTWLGLDQMVNASAKIYQANPVVAVLNSGNVVIVYASFNTNTMQDVYGQIFSPTGQKIGGEFQVNEFTAYNQRTPAVAALNDGKFAVAWVSEQKRAVGATNSTAVSTSQFQLPSVDIYARLLDAGGTAAGSEFLVNENSNANANPALAAATDGSVVFAWSCKDSKVLNNGWDVYARPFTFSGSVPLAGTERRVNTQLYGDQFAPRISSLGTNYMVVWTSLGQDGSAAGIYGQFLNVDGSSAGDELRINSATLGAQQEPALASDGSGRFLAAWTSPSFSVSRNDLFARIYADGNFVLPAPSVVYIAPKYVGEVAAKTDSFSSKTIPGPYVEPPTLGYPGIISSGGSALPAPDAFASAAGNYQGLFYEPAGVSPAHAGYFTAKTTAGKGYSAKLTLGGASYSFSGSFNDLGQSGAKTIKRGTATPLTVNLQLDLFGGDQISGQVQAGSAWTATLVADRQVFNLTTRQTPLAGQYTFAIPGAGAGESGPAGNGFGTASVDAAGVVKWGLTLADGTKPSSSKSPSVISKSGVWPLYGTFGGGAVIGWVQLSTNTPGQNSAVAGEVIAFKAASASAKYYKSGYTNGAALFGAQYVPPVTGSSLLRLSGAGLSSELATSVEFVGSGQPTRGVNLKTFTLKSNGSFTGSLSSPGLSFQGVLLDGGVGAGYFIHTNKQSGQVNLNQP